MCVTQDASNPWQEDYIELLEVQGGRSNSVALFCEKLDARCSFTALCRQLDMCLF